jgi:hypothetical protein
MNKGLTIRANQTPVKRQWPRLFEHVKSGLLEPSAIVTHRVPLEEIAEGYHLMANKLDGCIKPLIIPASTIPGWGVDLDPANRPSVPKERAEDRGVLGFPAAPA